MTVQLFHLTTSIPRTLISNYVLRKPFILESLPPPFPVTNVMKIHHKHNDLHIFSFHKESLIYMTSCKPKVDDSSTTSFKT